MKKTILVLLAMVMLSGCGSVKKYCFIEDNENHFISPGAKVEAVTGSIMIKKWECVGRGTVDQCTQPLELLYLGRAHAGNYIRIASRVGSGTKIVAEAIYREDLKLIDFQDAKIEVIEASDNSISFRLISISTIGCDKVNGQDVNQGVTK